MKLRTFFVLACAALLMASCAKNESENASVVERDILAKWIATHVSDPTLAEHADGLYTIVKQSTSSLDALTPADGDWVEVIFTGYAMPTPPMAVYPQDGKVFVTRDAGIAAQQLGSSNLYRTHYAAKKMSMTEGYNGMTTAMFRTLQMMKKGETWRFFAPSGITYGSSVSSYSYGYQGQSALGGGVPSYMDIELVNVIKDLTQYEQDSVWNYAKRNLGKTVETDYVKDRPYLYLTQEYLGVDQADTKTDTIGVDSTLNIYYVGRFLDGFVFDTNIDTVAQRVWGSTTGGRTPYEYKPSSGGLIQAFYDAIMTVPEGGTNMRYNSWGHMVFKSDYGYGSTGQTPNTTNYATEIDPYTPLVFDFYIAPWDGTPSDLKEKSIAYADFSSNPFNATQPWSTYEFAGTQPWVYVPYNYSGYFSVAGMDTALDSWLISPPYDFSAANLPRMYVTYRLIKGATGKNADISIHCSNGGGIWKEIQVTSYPTEYTRIGPILLDQYAPGTTFQMLFRLNSTTPTDSKWDIKGIEFFQMVKDE
ncbi:MAG: FKBP-type peptidyl-prolyl cis-trans isomerase [Rikenellaceae bacterium]|jgi:hypothetical protein|nr:FKBP-type peptidyl-prolyl cis-trans isomerase [Rikenellaceae bacterium]